MKGHGHGDKLPRKQEVAIACLLTEPTHEAAARKAGISGSTLSRWLKLDSFVAAYRAARAQAIEKAIATLQGNTWAASSVLLQSLGSKSDALRLRAAVEIWTLALKGKEILELEERIAALEAQAGEASKTPGRGKNGVHRGTTEALGTDGYGWG